MAVKKVVETAVKVVKDLPKALEANKAVQTAKDIEKKIDAILDKPKITAADAKKVDQLSKQVDENLKKAVDLGASTSKNSPVTQVQNAVKTKVAEVKAEAPKPAPVAKAAPKAEEAPGPSNLPKSTPTKTAAKAPEPAAKPTTKTTTKVSKTEEPPAPVKASKSKISKLEKVEEDKPPYGVFPAIGGTTAGGALDRGTPGGTGGDGGAGGGTGGNVIPSEDMPFGGGTAGGGDGGTGGGEGGGTGGGAGGDSGGGAGGGAGGGDGGGAGGGGAGGDGGGDGEQGGGDTTTTTQVDFGTQWLILKAKLLAAGLPESTVDASVDYFRTIIKDAKFAGPNELENVVDQYLYLPTYQSKAGTVVDSPFYKDFGKFNEKLTTKKKPGELVGLVLGYKRVIDKYITSDTARTGFKSDESITKYMQNDVSVAELDERANAARLRSINADPFYVKALMELKYIDAPSDLTSFFLDPNIGTKALEDRRTSGVFATEAIRRAGEATGIKLDTEFAKQQAAKLTGLGYTEAQITQIAGQGYENIAEQLRPTEKLSGIYERELAGGAADATKVQQELQAEQFLGTASQRRKKLAEQEIQAFRGQSGLSTTALRTSGMGLL